MMHIRAGISTIPAWCIDYQFILFLLSLVVKADCTESYNSYPMVHHTDSSLAEFEKGSFGYDLNFLRKYHQDLVLLGNDSAGPQVIVLPAYQGRVMTSTAEGSKGQSFGWVNHEFIASGELAAHIHAFGGEERFWLGPEGGQFSIYFKKGVPFTFDHWYVPSALDTEPFTLVSATTSEARLEKVMHLENYSGNQFDLKVDRIVRLLDKEAVDSVLGTVVPEGVRVVAFESENTVTNTGDSAWNKKTGLLSIWILSMLNASDKTTIAIPFKQEGSAAEGIKGITDDYFGKVPADRLQIKNNLILFKADAACRSKIGIAPGAALPVLGSYDAVNNMLTIAQFTLPAQADDYVNSLWSLQDQPFAGDAVNAYNDGPLNGQQMGKFYELESSSPAAALQPGKSIKHIHRTIHLLGEKDALNAIALKMLGVQVDAIAL